MGFEIAYKHRSLSATVAFAFVNDPKHGFLRIGEHVMCTVKPLFYGHSFIKVEINGLETIREREVYST